MYTNLPQQRIINNIRTAVQEALLHRQSLPDTTDLSLLPDPDIIMDHVIFIVSNTFLGNDHDHLRQQTVGIPMGTNSAPEMANLCLYNLLDSNQLQLARQYSYTKRYIDDLLLWNLEPPPPSIYGLEYCETKETDTSLEQKFLFFLINIFPWPFLIKLSPGISQ